MTPTEITRIRALAEKVLHEQREENADALERVAIAKVEVRADWLTALCDLAEKAI